VTVVADSLSADEAQALILRAQGFGKECADPAAVLPGLGVIHLDSVNIMARSQELLRGGYIPDIAADSVRFR
jgi:uncharacterized protein YcaQ